MIFNIVYSNSTDTKILEYLKASISKLTFNINFFNSMPANFSSGIWLFIDSKTINDLPKDSFVFITQGNTNYEINNNLIYLFSNKADLNLYVNKEIDKLKIFYLPIALSSEYMLDVNGKQLWSNFEHFDWHFFRALLSTNAISYEVFEKNVSFPDPKNSWICLTIPELPERHNHFLSQKINAFPLSPIKRNPGWKGHCYTTKFIFSKALEYNLEKITILEDDIKVNENFITESDDIHKYLDSVQDWDIFAGLIAQIDSNVLKVDNSFVYLDTMVSCVFNVYNKSIFSHIAAWDINTDDPWKQFDRWIRLKQNLKVITKYPFFIRHASNVKSSIWNEYNSALYDSLIDTAQKELFKRKQNWMEKNVNSF